MAEQKPMTDSEIEGAFREAERFAKLLGAFAAVRDVAALYLRMKQDTQAMQKQQAGIEASVAKIKADEKNAEQSHATKVAKLKTDFEQKESALRKSHDAKLKELSDKILDLDKRRHAVETGTDDAEVQAAQRLLNVQNDILTAQEKAAATTAKLDADIAAKQMQLASVTQAFESFKKQHGI